ncbi:MAG: N-acetylmuramoyl-L-alanine amidase [Lachnospiraceae bacterium]
MKKYRKKQQRLAIGLLVSALVLVMSLIGIFAVKMVEKSQKSGSGKSTESTSSRTVSTDSGQKDSSVVSKVTSASSSEAVSSAVSIPTTSTTSSAPAEPTTAPVEPTTAPAEPTTAPAEPTNTPAVATKIVCIDPGHELTQITDLEPIAPGSSEMKQGVTSGTEGATSGKTEYQVNLEVSQLLRDILKERGYEVVMTRETNDVTLSNVQRAQLATAANADIFVRIHCNGLENTEINGVLCYGPTEGNPYLTREVIDGSRRLCQLLKDNQCAVTGQKALDNLYEDNMTGINWATMPVAIVEMGFMTNPQEDLYMASPEGQQAIATGLANGIDAYFAVG